MKVLIAVLIYIILISIIASALTVIDKGRAKKGKWRIPETTLMLAGLFGGAFAEYFTMKRIHHKTRHSKFMIGLPLEIFLHIIIIGLIIYKATQN